METTTINILIICCAAAVITFIISIARWIQRVQIKNIEKSIIFDERDRKDRWEEKLLERNEKINSLKEENNSLKKEIDSLKKKIEALQNKTAIEYLLMNKLGDTTKEELDKEKERIQEHLNTIEKYINNKYYENTDNNA
jgi:chromosome segregation ATPase